MAKGNYKHAEYIIKNGKKIKVKSGMKNKEYWEERFKDNELKYFGQAEEFEKELLKSYKQALKEIQKEYNNFFSRYGEEGKNTLVESKKKLTSKEYKVFLEELKEHLKTIEAKNINDSSFRSLTKTLSNRTKITRMEELEWQLQKNISNLAVKMEDGTNKVLKDSYKGANKLARFYFDARAGISAFNKLNDVMVERAIKEPWSSTMWSENIWNNREWTTKKMRQHIVNGLIKGENPKLTAKRFEKVMVGTGNIKDNALNIIGAPNDNSFFAARRLIQTETKHVLTQGSHDVVVNSKVEGRYKIDATMDRRTSAICRKLNGTYISLNDANTSTMSPYHPFCRTVEIFQIRGIDYDKDLDNPQTKIAKKPEEINKEIENITEKKNITAVETYRNYKKVSANEAIKSIKGRYKRLEEIKIGRISKETKELALNDLNYLSSRYKINNSDDNLNEMYIASKGKNVSTFRYGTLGQVVTYKSGIKKIGLNSKYYKTMEELKASYTKGHASFVDDDLIASHTTFHEFGHLILSNFDQESEGKKAIFDFLTKDKMVKKFEEESYRIKKEFREKSRELKKYDEKIKLRAELIESTNGIVPSFYSTTNKSELIAEAFAEYCLSSNPGQMALKIGKLIDKYYLR